MNKTIWYTTFASNRVSVKKAFASLTLFICSGLQLLSGQPSPTSEYQLKAVFLFNFTQFVEWPAAAFSAPGEPFIIGILGDDPFGSYMEETVAGEQVMGHPMLIQRYSSVKDIKTCHILFIRSNDPLKMKTALSGVGNRCMLTVSDMDNFASLGGMIGFVTRDNKIRLQIKPAVAKNAGLNISSKLLRLADIID